MEVRERRIGWGLVQGEGRIEAVCGDGCGGRGTLLPVKPHPSVRGGTLSRAVSIVLGPKHGLGREGEAWWKVREW